MKKRKRIIVGVLFVAFAFAVFIGVRTAYNAFHSSETAEVNRSETITPTTTGEQCTNTDAMESYYGADVSVDSNNSQVISVNHGTFRATSVRAINDDNQSIDYRSLITVDPTQLGTLSSSDSMTIPITDGADGRVIIHFVLNESDEKCLAYDLASMDTDGQKIGTFEMDVELELNPVKAERDQVANTNYNGICAVFRTGEGYSNYANVFGNRVSQSDIQQYNYNAVNDTQRSTYNNIMSYCLNQNVEFNYTEKQTVSLIEAAISIVSSQTSSSATTTVSADFLSAFIDTRNKATDPSLGHDYSSHVSNGSLDDTRIGLTCAWDLLESESDYYVNKDYYYAQETETENVQYTYHYTGSSDTSTGATETVSGGACTRTCEEAVVVEYGAPVASKAGLCFEYKVRVTSRVICNADTSGIRPPSTAGKVCTPTPFCNNIPGKTHQGGPSDEFDECIMSCDGGEYSDSCSQQCYAEVYGDDESGYDPLAIRYGTNATVEQLSAFPGYDGRYNWSGNSIVWRSGRSYNTYGRWYLENEPTRTANEHDYAGSVGNGGRQRYLPSSDGFKRQNFTNALCTDPCYWSGCSRYSYLNDEDAAKDAIENLTAYNAAIAQCDASASCTTKTAQFTIGVDYINNKGNTVTVDFPLTDSPAHLPSQGDGATGGASGTDIFIPELTIDTDNEDGYSGCYNSSDAQNWYEAAWSFPGTYVNNKSGEIQFTTPQNPNAWRYDEGKFCMPLDAQSTNVTWWEWSELDNKTCHTATEISKSIDYNIHASTTDFGYFGWNFDIECFYGLKNEVTDLDSNGCPDPDPDPDPDPTTSIRDYAFRIVDLNNLFPEGENTTSANASQLSSTGRQPGYNWTLGMTDEDAAVITALQAKNPNYNINPLSLIDSIQARGNSTYSDRYLDYQIVLDTETLREIREYNDRMDSYTDYGGNTTDRNGVTSYVSDLLNDLGSNVKERGTAGVNNDGEGD